MGLCGCSRGNLFYRRGPRIQAPISFSGVLGFLRTLDFDTHRCVLYRLSLLGPSILHTNCAVGVVGLLHDGDFAFWPTGTEKALISASLPQLLKSRLSGNYVFKT